MNTNRTDALVKLILQEFGPCNGGHLNVMADFARTLEEENQKLIKQIKTLLHPNHIGNAAFEKIRIQAFYEGSDDAQVPNKEYKNPYEGKGFNSLIVNSYKDGWNHGLKEWRGTT